MSSRFLVFCALLLGILAAPVIAQTTDAQNPSDQRKRLIEQKIRLVELLINSPAAQNSAYGREAEAPALILSGKKLLDKARTALAANQFDEAGVALDEALRSVSKASSKISAKNDSLSQSAQQESFRNLSDQVATYRLSLADLVKQGISEAKPIVAQVDTLIQEANTLFKTTQLGDANRKLAEAYKLAIESLTRLRAGQTVTLSLKFDSPEQEYEYEIKRFNSGEIMVNMMVDEGRAEGDRRKLVDGFVGEGKRLHEQASDLARSRDYKSAVSSMEKATIQLNRALQAMGVPVF
jgi:hypothetical protein